jgi:HEAT repeat protein
MLGDPKLHPGTARQQAFLAIRDAGTNAVPFLLREIKRGSAIDGTRRAGVVEALEALGGFGQPALPKLTEITLQGDERSAETALWALSRMGRPGVEAMTNALVYATASRRLKVVQMLHSMGTNAHAAVPALVLSLRNVGGDYETAFWAGCGAARASLEASEVVPGLATNLLEADSACRFGSASGLRLLGREASSAIPVLKLLLTDTNEQVRSAASDAILNIQR